MTAQNGTFPPSPNKRLAPRLSNQFRVGPPFCATVNKIALYDSKNAVVVPKITARLDRGFNLVDGEWIGYKRNYFTLVAAFFFAERPLNVAATESFFYLQDNRRVPLRAFKIMLTSVCPEDNASAVTLVQHTAKRDRGPQSLPPVYYAVPGELPAHLTMKLVANIRNGDKIDRCNRLFYLLKEEVVHVARSCPHAILASYPPNEPVSLVSRYERIQFSSAGCGNRKSASTNNKHYILVVQLLGEDASGNDVVLAYSKSPPLVVRGRLPSNYPQGSERLADRIDRMGAERGVAQGRNLLNLPLPQSLPLPIPHIPSHGSGGSRLEPIPASPDFIDDFFQLKRPKTDSPLLNRVPTSLSAWDSVDPQLMSGKSKMPENLADWAAAEPILPFLWGSEIFPPVLTEGQNENQHEPWREVYAGTQPDMFSSHSSEQGHLEREQTPAQTALPVLQSVLEVLNERLHSQSSGFPELMDLEKYLFINTYSTYQALPGPVISDPLHTSTPLQLKIESKVQEQPSRFSCNQVARLNGDVRRCKHGFKACTQKKNPRLYSLQDLENSAQDAGFVAFKRKIDTYAVSPPEADMGSSIMLSLTTISSEE